MPVAPFPPIDDLEVLKLHPLVLDAPLVDLFVLFELSLPVGLAQGWDCTGNGPPFGDRQPAVGQPCQPPHDDHRHDQSEQNRQPGTYGAPCAATGAIDPTGLGLRALLRLIARDVLENAALAHACLFQFPVKLGRRSAPVQCRVRGQMTVQSRFSFQRTICRITPCSICTSARVSGRRLNRLRKTTFMPGAFSGGKKKPASSSRPS